MKILTNHLGYDPQHPKVLIVKTDISDEIEALMGGRISIKNARTHEVVYTGPLKDEGPVARWKKWHFFSFDFTPVDGQGKYYASLECESLPTTPDCFSQPFSIVDSILPRTVISDLLFYFKGQRSSGIWDQADRNAPFVGDRRDRVDVHGGWYDASGDYSKYLSHLSYGNYLNPQQIPMVVWNFLDARERLAQATEDMRLSSLGKRLEEEALFGGDYLLRILDPDGYFYMTIFDTWSKQPDQREICAYKLQTGVKLDSYPAAYRQGGGIAIAALARLSTLGKDGEYSCEAYLEGAKKAFAHLEDHNSEYCDDGEANIIDFYCALVAATELYGATDDQKYLQAARSYRDLLMAQQRSDENYRNFWAADTKGERPYFHAAEAGLPGIALLRYSQLEPEKEEAKKAWETVIKSLSFELDISAEVTNPFGYGRQYVKDLYGPKRSAFFVSQKNESGYWWQGENARLASLATLGFKLLNSARDNWEPLDKNFIERLERWSLSQVNWVLGLNPYDMCMLQGRGHDNPDYLIHFPNAPGGVANGITAGFHDPEDIDFNPRDQREDMLQNWRWGEQWIPHGAWLLLATASMAQLDARVESVHID